MSDITKKQATINGLLAIGCKETKRSSKYRTFDLPGGEKTFMVGKSGALRVTKGPLSQSASLTGLRKHAALAYTGRIYRISGANLTPAQYVDIYIGVLKGEIPVTKGGFYDDEAKRR